MPAAHSLDTTDPINALTLFNAAKDVITNNLSKLTHTSAKAITEAFSAPIEEAFRQTTGNPKARNKLYHHFSSIFHPDMLNNNNSAFASAIKRDYKRRTFYVFLSNVLNNIDMPIPVYFMSYFEILL